MSVALNAWIIPAERSLCQSIHSDDEFEMNSGVATYVTQRSLKNRLFLSLSFGERQPSTDPPCQIGPAPGRLPTTFGVERCMPVTLNWRRWLGDRPLMTMHASYTEFEEVGGGETSMTMNSWWRDLGDKLPPRSLLGERRERPR